jgi:hypothetical protein
MNNRRTVLDVIEVREPCTASWESMRGDERVRFCTHCQKHVHNLSAMPRDEAERLACEQAGRLCVRFEQAPGSGAVVTLDYRPAKPPRRRGLFWATLGVAGALAAAAPNGIYSRVPSKRTVILGQMCPIPPTTTPTTLPVPAPTTPAGPGAPADSADPAAEG